MVLEAQLFALGSNTEPASMTLKDLLAQLFTLASLVLEEQLFPGFALVEGI